MARYQTSDEDPVSRLGAYRMIRGLAAVAGTGVQRPHATKDGQTVARVPDDLWALPLPHDDDEDVTHEVLARDCPELRARLREFSRWKRIAHDRLLDGGEGGEE